VQPLRDFGIAVPDELAAANEIDDSLAAIA
jgi:hypothetical protein